MYSDTVLATGGSASCVVGQLVDPVRSDCIEILLVYSVGSGIYEKCFYCYLGDMRLFDGISVSFVEKENTISSGCCGGGESCHCIAAVMGDAID